MVTHMVFTPVFFFGSDRLVSPPRSVRAWVVFGSSLAAGPFVVSVLDLPVFFFLFFFVPRDDEDEDIRNVLSEFLYKLKKSEEALNNESKHAQLILQQRMTVFNTDISRRCMESKCIKFYPKVESRIVNLATPIEHID